MWAHMDGWGPGVGWFMIGHALWWVLVFFGLGAFVLWALGRGPRGRRPPGPAEDRALTVLRERYARGEIDEQEFEERKRVLGR